MSQCTRGLFSVLLAGVLAFSWGPAHAGYTRKPDPHGNPDPHGHPKPGCHCHRQQGHSGGNQASDPNATSPASGMPRYSVSPMLISLTFNDTPLAWSPAVGPDMSFALSYHQMDIDQPQAFAWSNVGPKWSFNWLSYVQDDPNHPGNKVLTYMPGGPGRPDQGFNAGTGAFAPEAESGAQLVQVSADPVIYERRFADGSKDVYAESDGATTYPRHVFMTRRVDAHGNAVTLHYDNLHRLVQVSDAAGHALAFQYADDAHPHHVTGVNDSFGRSVALQYDGAGRLAGITDVMGMTSTFTYGAGTSITALTTPYGTTHFDTHQQGVRRWIDITDTDGNTSRWEFNEAVSGIPFSVGDVPKGIRAFNRYLNSRDSFYWDATTFKRYGVDYTKALNYHWTHKTQGSGLSSVTADALESIKYPLESRIWYNHPGDIPGGSGTLNKPTAAARVLPDGSTQFRGNQYDNQGRLVRSVDPSGLETDYTYASNGIDVAKIERKGPDGSDSIETFTYDDRHDVLSHTDETGAVTTYTYNAQGQVLTKTDALGHATRYTYDAQGNPTSITDPEGHTTRFTYDALGRRTSRTDALGRKTSYQYDALNRRVRTNYPDGSYTATTWDKLDKVTFRNRDGHVTRYTYDAMRDRISATDALGRTTHWAYYPNGQLKSRTDPEGNTTTWQRDIEGRVIAVTDAANHATSFTYDSADRRTRVTNALGQVTATVWDSMDRPVRMTDPNGVMTDNTYTARGWLATQTVHAPGQSGATTTFAHDAHGDRIAMTDADGVKTAYVYDAAHQLSAVDDALGNTQVYTRDADGQLVARANAASGSTDLTYLHRSAYDAAHQRIASVDADGHTTRYRYDKAGHLATMTDPLGVHTYTRFDAEGHLLDSVQGVRGHSHHGVFGSNTAKVSYQYDAAGQLVKVIDPDGLATTYAYDAAGHKAGQVSPDTGATEYAHDAVGNLVKQTDARGVETDRTYDALKRLVAVHYPSDPSEDVHFHYGDANSATGCENSYPVGRLTRMTDPSGSTTYCYDARGNVITEQRVIGGHAYSLTYAWTPANRLAAVVYPDGVEATYRRDVAGRVTAITVEGPHDTSPTTVVGDIDYLPFGPITKMAYGQGQLVLTRRYDGNYRGTAIDGLGLHLKVKRDANGNIIAARKGRGRGPLTERYHYDALQRLTAVTGPWDFLRQRYTYNATGDRTSKITARDGLVRYRYQPGSHRLAAMQHGFGWMDWNSFCGWPFGRACHRLDDTVLTDANGNQIRMPHDGKALDLVYGANNRLAKVMTNQGQSASYLYDGHGLRVEKSTTDPDQTRDFLYQGTRLLAEYAASSSDQRDYLWLGRTLVASLDTTPEGTQVHYVATDFLGTPRRATSTQGQPVWSWPYLANPFGERPARGSYAFNLRFPGQYHDAVSGLSYNVHRDYDARSGRYVESDPIGLRGGTNTYTYVANGPLTGIDALGNVVWSGTMTGAGAAIGVGGAVYHIVLDSNCVNGERGHAVLLVVGPAFGAKVEDGPPASITTTHVEFNDQLDYVDPQVLTGWFSMWGAGVSIFHGYGCSVIQLGGNGMSLASPENSGAISYGCGSESGVDASLGGVAGSSTLISSSIKECDECDK